MAVIEELIRLENDGTISFGNYLMETKKKVLDFDVEGDLYKVKTFREITKLEKNGKLLLESVPGVTIHNFHMTDREVSFLVEGTEDAQITMELEADTEYEIIMDDTSLGTIKTNLGGKINFNVEVTGNPIRICIEKLS